MRWISAVGVLLGIVLLFACALNFMATGGGPTPWHEFLRRNDARLMLLWLAALPTLAGLGLFVKNRLLGIALTSGGLLLTGLLTWVAPLEAERLYSGWMAPSAMGVPRASKLSAFLTFCQGITEPSVLFLLGYCAIWMLAKRMAPSAVTSAAGLFVFAFGLAFGTSAVLGWLSWVALRLPPNYHDEYAYLFQAWTYLDGRWAYPADELSPAFDQVHVLHRGVFASRYFPGTAMWMAPFVAAGLPIASMWTAFGLACGFFSLAARSITPTAGWLTALSIAASPGMIGFSDSLLSTMPTMAALGAFVWAWFNVHASNRNRWPIIAGIAVGFAFLTRPLSAAGIGFPFALYSLMRLWTPNTAGERRRLILMIAAFVCVASILPIWSYNTIGSVVETPYDRYTRESTPSHVYGFYNAERGRAQRTEQVFRPYDVWAANLTPWLACQTLAARVHAALQEGLGGLLFSGALLFLSLCRLPRCDDRALLIWLAILGLALAYTPYWFVGVFGYGYFAEALAFLLLLICLTAAQIAERSSNTSFRFVAAALPALIVLRSLLNVADLSPTMFNPGSDAQFARREKNRVVERENIALREGFKLLVLVDADPKTAVHSTLVNNHPRLDAPVVRAWDKPERREALLSRYPDRVVYLLRYKGFAEPFEWVRIRGPVR